MVAAALFPLSACAVTGDSGSALGASAGGAANGSDGGGTCNPTTCEASNAQCGSISDGCGGTLDCGTCTAPETCGGGGTPNVCGSGTAAGSSGGPTGGAGGASTTGGGSGTTTPLCTASVNGSYALPADRGTSWNLAGMLSKGGIPSSSWPVCNSTPLAPSGGEDTTQINDAIASCAPGGVVQLGPGTFTMKQGAYIAITKGVVLRGAGAGVTILKNPANGPATQSSQAAGDSSPIVIIGPGRWVNPDGDGRCQAPTAYQTQYMQLLASDGAKGASSITVADGSIFKAGQFVLLDETSNAGWQPDVIGLSTSVWASADYSVQWPLHNPAIPGEDPLSTGTTPSATNNFAGVGNGSDASCWFSRQDRPQNEIKEIASVNGNTVTFTSPLHKSYRVSNHAELTTYTGGNQHVVNAGIENLSAVGGGYGAVRFQNAAYSWAKNIEVTTWWGEGVSFENSFRSELRDSYIHDAAWAEPGGAGYALSISAASSELLIENNISVRANKVMVARSSGTGSVVAYNYMDQGYIATLSAWVEDGMNSSHMVGSHHVLFEGNESFNFDTDDTHGNSTYLTFFRNYATTNRAKFQNPFSGETIDDATQGGNLPRRAAGAHTYSYWMSWIGNVLGQPGVSTQSNGYVDDSFGTSWSTPTIWLLGWNEGGNHTPDPNVAKTSIRDGNWDAYENKQTWLTGSAAALPSSCYRTSKPAFFGSNTWPWVDPTTGTVHTLPAKVRYDAGTPNKVQ